MRLFVTTVLSLFALNACPAQSELAIQAKKALQDQAKLSSNLVFQGRTGHSSNGEKPTSWAAQDSARSANGHFYVKTYGTSGANSFEDIAICDGKAWYSITARGDQVSCSVSEKSRGVMVPFDLCTRMKDRALADLIGSFKPTSKSEAEGLDWLSGTGFQGERIEVGISKVYGYLPSRLIRTFSSGETEEHTITKFHRVGATYVPAAGKVRTTGPNASEPFEAWFEVDRTVPADDSIFKSPALPEGSRLHDDRVGKFYLIGAKGEWIFHGFDKRHEKQQPKEGWV